MKLRFPSLVAVAIVCVSLPLRGDVLLSELMYNPPQDSDYEYVEVCNSGPGDVDVGGWGFTSGIDFVFPFGTVLQAGGYVVVCRSAAAFRSAYPEVPAASVFGDYTGRLGNEGDRLVLANLSGTPVQTLDYDDNLPWDFLADGFGASLERICLTSSSLGPENWRAGPTPSSIEEFGGTPGAPNSQSLCPPALPARPSLYISELMYHPVLEDSLEDEHEFVEIYNAEAAAVDLGGWRLAGAIDFTFPAGASIGSGQYRVIAKHRTRLAAVASYGLVAAQLFGDYNRTLDNGGEKVALLSAGGQGVDAVTYDDDFPWPTGADALGAGRDWLPPALLPLENHRYRGYSLERVSFSVPPGEVFNWTTSPLDGATPGRANASARAVPLPIVADIVVQAVGGDPAALIRANEQVQVQAGFSPEAPAGQVLLDYFIDSVETTGEAVTTLTMHDDGLSGGDFQPGDGVYSTLLPGRPANSIVRYRIRADRGAGLEQVSPRTSDPFGWHAYFVSPVISATTRTYQLFVSRANWTQMWNNTSGGRVSGCAENTLWNATVPAVLVYEGEVFDVQTRYQGSRYNRRNGRTIASWPFPGPTAPSPLLALSWRIALPRYKQLEGRDVLILNKLTQSCPGYTSGVGFALFAAADLPAPLVRYARLHINGGYYHYTIEYERPGEEMMRRYHREQAAKYPGLPREDVGHLFKSVGCNCDEGPYGWGDWRALVSSCGWSVDDRYRYTYDRKTHDWDGPTALRRLMEDLDAARRSGIPALRSYFAANFDLDLLLNYMAVINWSVPFDDMFQNHFIYQRLSDGRWLLFPWDLDLNFGGWKGPEASIYMGEEGNPDNRSAWWHRLKDGFLKSYRAEFEERLLELNNTVLHPDNVNQLLNAFAPQLIVAEAQSAPAGFACSSSTTGFRNFASSRFNLVNALLSQVTADAGPDQTAFTGQTVQFDARNSRPDPGPTAVYTWSNGITGDYPTFVYNQAGVYDVTLTLTVNATPYRDTVRITVTAGPDVAFVESGGQVVMEAENFWTNDRHGAPTAWWAPGTALPGFAGSAYMEAMDTAYTRFPSNYASTSPELRYAILFSQPGTYRVWIRGLSGHTDYDSCHVNLNAIERDESFAQRFTVDASNFLWAGDTRSQGPQQVVVANAGLQFLSIWIRESGQIIDKIILTRNTGFTPSGAGPAESERRPTADISPFVRGDANRDGSIDLSDSIAVLFFLFAGTSAMTCEDHGDADDNGRLELTDAVALLDFLFRRGPAPRAPFPAPGRDATADAFDCGGP
jgi:hypothetical protein